MYLHPMCSNILCSVDVCHKVLRRDWGRWYILWIESHCPPPPPEPVSFLFIVLVPSLHNVQNQLRAVCNQLWHATDFILIQQIADHTQRDGYFQNYSQSSTLHPPLQKLKIKVLKCWFFLINNVFSKRLSQTMLTYLLHSAESFLRSQLVCS